MLFMSKIYLDENPIFFDIRVNGVSKTIDWFLELLFKISQIWASFKVIRFSNSF